MITKDEWDRNRPDSNPFLNYDFLNALIQSGSVDTKTGWDPKVIQNNGDGLLISFIKDHSYGEYIFDWGWAEAYQKYGIPYYPKLTSMVPFTPVTTQHFLLNKFDHQKAAGLLKKHDQFFEAGNFSSSHFLFLSPEEVEVFREEKYMIRESLQYHFFNPAFASFDQFLSTLKAKKAKTIKKERSFENLTITHYTKDKITIAHAEKMYEFYISTIKNKHSYDYLKQEFFTSVFTTMKDNILYVEAKQNDSIIAGSLFFYDSHKLYGRYWGSTVNIQNLHFELCYYQGIDFCIENKIPVFEAGAQGEHKIARGFRPVRTYSAHKIKHPGFKDAINDFIENEKLQVARSIEILSTYLPFKSKEI